MLVLVTRRSPKLNWVPTRPVDRSIVAMRSVPAVGWSGCAVQPLAQAAPFTRPGFTGPLLVPAGSGSSSV